MGVSFIALSSDHPISLELANKSEEIASFVKEINSTKLSEADMAKQGKDWHLYERLQALHPFSNDEIPIWIGNFVLSGYGSGALMGSSPRSKRLRIC